MRCRKAIAYPVPNGAVGHPYDVTEARALGSESDQNCEENPKNPPSNRGRTEGGGERGREEEDSVATGQHPGGPAGATCWFEVEAVGHQCRRHRADSAGEELLGELVDSWASERTERESE